MKTFWQITWKTVRDSQFPAKRSVEGTPNFRLYVRSRRLSWGGEGGREKSPRSRGCNRWHVLPRASAVIPTHPVSRSSSRRRAIRLYEPSRGCHVVIIDPFLLRRRRFTNPGRLLVPNEFLFTVDREPPASL